MKTFIAFTCCAAWLLAPDFAHARVKLVALPERARVTVSLDNPNATLVEEERLVTLQKGVNQVDFSWASVNIDSSSIQVRALGHPDKVTVLNTSYPPNENALIWAVSSPDAIEERFRISYLLSGLNRDIVYKAVAEPNEASLSSRNYLRLRNSSGEDLSNAEINIGYGERFTKNLAHEEVLELLSEKIERLPIKKVLTWDAAQQPWDPEYEKKTVGIPLSYVFTNDLRSTLGAHTLLPGKARIFLKTKDQAAAPGEVASDGITFTGEDWATLTPVDREMKLYIGQSREVKVVQRKTKDQRTNIRRTTGNADAMWDTDEEFKIEVENFKHGPVSLVIVEHIPGYWKIVESSHPHVKKNAYTIEFPLQLGKETTGTNKTTIRFQINRLNVQPNDPAPQNDVDFQ
ncbi:MAG: hypothetical protein JWM68_5672 [Verrucomicrobiales bacterium]|nr:hypothetical protein [Verrucomicrobiales bacterium]